MKLKTLKKWNKHGYSIIKGSKAIAFNKKGKALFAKSQTTIKCEYSYIEDPNDTKKYMHFGENV